MSTPPDDGRPPVDPPADGPLMPVPDAATPPPGGQQAPDPSPNLDNLAT